MNPFIIWISISGRCFTLDLLRGFDFIWGSLTFCFWLNFHWATWEPDNQKNWTIVPSFSSVMKCFISVLVSWEVSVTGEHPCILNWNTNWKVVFLPRECAFLWVFFFFLYCSYNLNLCWFYKVVAYTLNANQPLLTGAGMYCDPMSKQWNFTTVSI